MGCKRLVILPGMDGTGFGLGAFVEALRPSIDATIIDYPTDKPLSYAELAEYVRSRLPDEPYVLLGESFSGPIALKLAAERPPGLIAIVLAASFVRIAMPAKPVLKALIRLGSPRLMPLALLDRLLLGGNSDAELRTGLKSALRSVTPVVLKRRACEALSVDLPAEGLKVELPALYLNAVRDRLLGYEEVVGVGEVAPQLFVSDIDAPHFMLQTAPDICAGTIQTFLEKVQSIGPPIADH